MHRFIDAFLKSDITYKRIYPSFEMGNPDQETILLEQTYEEIKEIWNKFQKESGASDIEVKTLLRELARVWENEN